MNSLSEPFEKKKMDLDSSRSLQNARFDES